MYRNLIDEATLSSPGTTAGFPVAMLKDPARTKLCRQDGESLVIEGSWETPHSCSVLILANHNLGAARGTIRLQTDGGHDWTWRAWESIRRFGQGPLGAGMIGGFPGRRDVAELTAGPLRFIYLGPAWFQSWTLTLSELGGNPDGWIEVGRIFLGTYLEMPLQFSWGFELGHQDFSSLQRTPWGTANFIPQGQPRTQVLPFRKITKEAMYGEVLRWLRTVGNSRRFFVDPLPDGTGPQRFWHRIYCRRSDTNQVTAEEMFRGTAQVTLEEVL